MITYGDEEVCPEFEIKPAGSGVKVIITCEPFGTNDAYRAFAYVTNPEKGKSIEKAKVGLLTAFKMECGIYNSETKRF